MESTAWSAPTPTPAPSPGGRGSALKPFALLLTAAVCGGGMALGGAAVVGAFDSAPATTVIQVTKGGGSPAPAAALATDPTGLTVNEIYRRSGPGVVQITSTLSGQQAGKALGSGFVLDEQGHIVTNYHVVDGASSIDVRFSNDDTVKATLVGSDPSTDIALLRVDASREALTPLTLADSTKVEVGDSVVAIGNPFGLERTVTAGIVSALQRAVQAPNGFSIDHIIQTDAPINHGNSGGPLLDTHGRVIGVNSQIETGGSGDGNVGIGFAVPSNTVKQVVAQLRATGSVDHAYLGVSAVEVTSQIASAFKLPIEKGLVIQSVTTGSGAAGAGLKAGAEQAVIAGESFRMGGDVVVAADGKQIASIDDLRDVIAAHKPGDKIELDIYRGGAKKTVTVTLGRQPTSPSQ